MRADCAVYLWACAHVGQNGIETGNDVVRIGRRRALLRYRLRHHDLLVEKHLLLLDLLGHSLLHLKSHGVDCLELLLLLRKDWHHSGLHLHLLLRLRMRLLGLLRTSKQVKKVLVGGRGHRRLSMSSSCRLSICYGVDVAWVEESVAGRFARDELSGPTPLLYSLYPLKRLMQVVVYQKAYRHDFLVVNLPDHTDQFGLQLGQSSSQVVQGFALLSWLHLVNDLVGEVYVALDQVHVVHELRILAWKRR